MQYLAPYAGMALAEWYRDNGQHSLVIFDELSTHAKCYASMAKYEHKFVVCFYLVCEKVMYHILTYMTSIVFSCVAHVSTEFYMMYLLVFGTCTERC